MKIDLNYVKNCWKLLKVWWKFYKWVENAENWSEITSVGKYVKIDYKFDKNGYEVDQSTGKMQEIDQKLHNKA